MSDYDDLATLLAIDKAEKEAIAASDPYLQFKQVPDLLSGTVLKASADPEYSTSDKILAGFLTGLLGGATTGLSRDYQSRAQGAYRDVLGDLIDNPDGAVERPSVLSPNVFDLAKEKADIFGIQKKLIEKEKVADLLNKKAEIGYQTESDLTEALFDEYLKTPSNKRKAEIQGLLESRGIKFGASEKEAPKAEAEKTGRPVLMQDTIDPSIAGGASEKTVGPDRLQELYDLYPEDVAESIFKEESKLNQEKEDWLSKAPTPVQTKIYQAESATQELAALSRVFARLPANPAVFQKDLLFPSTDTYKAVSRLELMTPIVVRLSGEVGNIAEQEQARAISATLGNILSGGPDTAALVAQAAELYRGLAAKQALAVKTAIESGGDALLEKLNKPLDFTTQPTQQTQQIPPGMKLQRNKVTGETRLVPK